MSGTFTGIAAALSVVSGAMGYFANRDAAKSSRRVAGYEAGELERRAGQERAVGQRRGADIRRDFGFAGETATARFGVTGTAPDARLLARIASEGDYQSGIAAYETEERARAMEQQALFTRYRGERKSEELQAAGVRDLVGGAANAAILGADYYGDTAGPGAETEVRSFGTGPITRGRTEFGRGSTLNTKYRPHASSPHTFGYN